MTLNCNGKILDFSTKKIMGIVNISKDSFFDGGKYDSIEKVNSQVSKLIGNGADIIDLGAVSSKPGSKLIEAEEEYELIHDYINEITSNFNDVLFSIDTYNSSIADFALSKGFSIVNDISSGKYDNNMFFVGSTAAYVINKKGQKFVILIGSNEIQNKTVIFKNLSTGEQTELTNDELFIKLNSIKY